MSYTYQNNDRKMIEIKQVKRHFMLYEDFHKVRNDKSVCGICKRGFRGNQYTNLAIVVHDTNQLICDKCANRVIAGGAKGV